MNMEYTFIQRPIWNALKSLQIWEEHELVQTWRQWAKFWLIPYVRHNYLSDPSWRSSLWVLRLLMEQGLHSVTA